MTTGFDLISRLTSPTINPLEQGRMVKDFAQLLGWEPSERLDPTPNLQDVTHGHLIVEHGLENSAVITFLISPASQASLSSEQNRQILGISYNNLIDWHIYVERNQVTYIFNRIDPPEPVIQKRLSSSDIDGLRSTMLDQITGKAPNPNFPALDNALADTISYWKRNLAAELGNEPGLADYSALFNAIIFVRAVEDHQRRLQEGVSRVLLDEFGNSATEERNLRLILGNVLHRYINGRLPKNLFDPERLRVFDDLNPDLAYDLLSHFYKSLRVPYAYDFAIMSKHALSRIYEHYVSLLSFEEKSPQLSFVPRLPEEQYSKNYGSVYTPQFIARFFARFLHDLLPPITFRKLRILDPACGSGMFLRTFLEFQCARDLDAASSDEINLAFQNVKGIDIDENAAQATRLSLSLLYLVLMSGDLPKSLDIEASDALSYFESHPDMKGQFDVIVANPPFISADNQSKEWRSQMMRFMGELARGKQDSYAPFLKMAVDALKPGGYGMFVLPHSFLRQQSAQKVREYLQERTWIRCLADLSDIEVFGDKASYAILFIFQKKAERALPPGMEPEATIIFCRSQVGQALQDYLSGKRPIHRQYSIYNVEQIEFAEGEWNILPPQDAAVLRKFNQMRPLGDFASVLQGVVTGADNVFIRPLSEISQDDLPVWKPLLRDRDMQRYTTPGESAHVVFCPMLEGQVLSEHEIAEKYPKTWQYLLQKRDSLLHRGSAISAANWWLPARLRDPGKMFRPKIITPHLILLPRFSLDVQGKYLVSRSPVIVSLDLPGEMEVLKFILGVLNSTVGGWLLSRYSDKYSHGYARLEGKTLRSVPVPDPSKVPFAKLSYLLGLVDKKLAGNQDEQIDQAIDQEVAMLYGLTQEDIAVLGFKLKDKG